MNNDATQALEILKGAVAAKIETLHNPNAFIPEDYEVVDFLENRQPEFNWVDFGESRAAAEQAAEAHRLAVKAWGDQWARYFGRNANGYPAVKHQCQHCGAHLRYVVITKHKSGNHVAIGETCAERVNMTLGQFKRKMADQKKRAKLTRESGGRLAMFLDKHPELVEMVRNYRTAIAAEGAFPNGFVDNILYKAERYGDLSDAQRAKVMEVIPDHIAKVNEVVARKARDAELAANAPAIENGRYRVAGEVLTTKWQDSMYGSTLKMLVRLDDGNKVWGSVPSAIDPDRGDRVAFTAAIEQSNDDEHFGFFKRPTKAEVIRESEAA